MLATHLTRAALRTSAPRCAAAAPATPASAASAGSAGLAGIALARAKDVDAKWQGTSTLGGTTKNFRDGAFVESKASTWCEVRDPVSGYRPEQRTQRGARA
jgi:malonate-semialdehyde dehydrogenase (acetylating)/methylmalonate-semialdehyde dehydrogenase